MHYQKDQLGHRLDTAGKAFKMLPDIVDAVGLSFSGRHNALYGMEDFIRAVISMCKSGSYASGITQMLSVRHAASRIPSSVWVPGKIRDACSDRHIMEKRCREMVRKTVLCATQAGLLRRTPHVMAIDTHNIPRYDRSSDTREKQLVRSKHRNGTTRFEGYATMQCVDRPNLDVACRPLKKGYKPACIVRDLLQDCADVGVRCKLLLLLDRGFFSSDVIREIRQADHGFIMPASKTFAIKRAILDHHDGKRDAVSTHTLMTRKHKQGQSFRLVIVAKKKGDRGGMGFGEDTGQIFGVCHQP